MATTGQQSLSEKPSRLGGFEILEKLGEGGMGAVYQAKQVSLERIVALKVLTPKLAADAKYTDGFLREARSAARLNHPNIVHVYDAGQADGFFYYAMEFIRGETLFQWLKRDGALPEETVVGIGLCIASALKHAWDTEQLIHRDVKPENIMVDSGGNVKLCDMGLAKNFGQDTLLSMSGQAFGTPNYMSPEQARAERTVDCRSDIYSLGLSLYHAVTGQIPFYGGSAALVMARHLSEQLPDPRELGIGASENFCRVLQRMCAKDAADRYQSWSDVIADLELVRRGETPRAETLEQNKSSIKREEWANGGMGAVGRVPPPAEILHGGTGVPPVYQKKWTGGTPIPPSESHGSRGRPPSKFLLVGSTIVVVLLAASAGLILWLKNRPAPSPPPTTSNVNNGIKPPDTRPPDNVVVVPDRAKEAVKALEEIKAFIQTTPTNFDQSVAKLQKFISDFPNLPPTEEAKKLLAEVETQRALAIEEEKRQKELEAIRIAEQKKLEEQLRKEAEQRAAAEKAFVEFTKPFLESLAKRDYAGAKDWARQAAENPVLTPLKENLVQCGETAARLETFWASLPNVLIALKGKELTVQSVTGVLTEISNGDLVLEKKIGDSGAVTNAVAISKLTTDELLALLEQTTAKNEHETLLTLAWFCFAEGKPDLANAYVKKGGGDPVPVQNLMTLLAQGPTEDTTRKLLATTLAAMEQKSWTDARQKLRQLQAHVETTSSTSVSKADLLAMEEKVALGEWNNVVVKARAGTVLKTLKTTTSAPLVAMSPDGKYVLAGYSGKLCLYDVISGTTLKTFDGSAPSFHPKGTLVFVKKADDELTLFEIPSGKEAQSWGKEKYLNRVVFSPDGGLAFGFGGGKEMKLWNVGSGKLVPAFAGKTAESLIYCAAFSPDGRYLLTGGTSVQLWEIATGKLIRELGAAPPSGSTIQNRALAVGFSTDGASAYVCWFIEGRVVGWEITTGKEVKNFQAVANPNGRPDGAVFSSSGRFVMTKDNVTLRVFDIESGKQVHTFPVPRYTPSFGFSRDELLGFYGDGHRGTVSLLKIWDGDRPPAPPLKR